MVRNKDVEHISMVSDRQGVLIDVEQETALTVLRRRVEEDRTYARASVSVVSGTGQYESVGECILPNSGKVWPIPRSTEDVALIGTLGLSKFRISDYGHRLRIGAYVWNRDKRPKFDSFQDVNRAGAYTAIPLLWSRKTSTQGVVRLEDISTCNGENRFVVLGSKTSSAVIRSPCVVLQRVTSNYQPRRLVAASVSQEIFETYVWFVGENHVVIIEQVIESPAFSPIRLAEILSSYAMDRYFRCISSAKNVSAFELNHLALPDPIALQSVMKNGNTLDQAMNEAYNFVLES
ncbi:hypothetical protein [Pseudomonas asiatica]|uniref:hypothetical protein n=1 Tax=Pseudomonas asiatica TaxID=2219225 RepID=UPI0037CA39F7